MSLCRQATTKLAKQTANGSLNALISGPNVSSGIPRQGLHAPRNRESNGLSLRALEGEVVHVKDNICTPEQNTTCASAILDGFSSPYSADVVQTLENAGAVVNAKTNLDEFGMGSNSTLSYHGPVRNVYSGDLSAGGSSGGSAVAVASNQCFAALGTDTGGSVRLPAAYNGIVGFKPSYGVISRWGVVAYANSLDTVGILARKVDDASKIFDVLQNAEGNDPTVVRTRHSTRETLGDGRQFPRKKLTIGVPREYNTQELQPLVRAAWVGVLERLHDAGHRIRSVSLPSTSSALSAYYVLAPAEASSNLAKYDGARYGNRLLEDREDSTRGKNVLYAKTRGHGLGEEVRKRILLGAYSLSAAAMDNYFIQAQRVRRLVQVDFDNAFVTPNPLHSEAAKAGDSEIDPGSPNDHQESKRVDFIVAPTAQSLPPKLDDIQKQDRVDAYTTDVFTVPASLAGLPSISVPVDVPTADEKEAGPVKTVGIQIIGQYGSDTRVLDLSRELEKLFG